MSSAPTAALLVSVPVETAVVSLHRELVTGTHFEHGKGTVIEMDVRRKDWRGLLNLPKDTTIGFADIRTVDIQELSTTPFAMCYRLTLGDGWYKRKGEERQYFGVGQYLTGIDLERQMTEVAVRAGVLLAVLGGVGLRCVCWLMYMLFHVDISKSALERYVKECAAQLPDAKGMALAMHKDKPITRAHMDEIFARGQRPKRCTVVLRDEHGRIFAIRELAGRTAEAVKEFLLDVKGWGIELVSFHVDGCEAYRDAIREVFPNAVIQYDYFHVVQCIFKKLWKMMVQYRRDLKARAKKSSNAAYGRRLESLAKALWENRHLVFKRDKNMSPEEKQRLTDLVQQDSLLPFLRGFQKAVTAIFETSVDEDDAKQRLADLWKRSEVIRYEPFAKAVAFLDSRFDDMTTFLRHPHLAQRNSLSETGIRFLRRLEQGHDGFRSAAGLDRHLRIFQAVKYLGWTVHGAEGGLGLPQ